MTDNTIAEIVPTQNSGLAWRVKEVRKLTGAENAGRRNVFLAIYRAGAAMVRDGSVYVRWTWDGKHDDEIAPPAKCDKVDALYCADIPIDPGQHISIWVDDGRGAPSDIVRNIHAELPGDGPGNEYHHHSWFVRYEIGFIAPTSEPPTLPGGNNAQAIALLEQAIRILRG